MARQSMDGQPGRHRRWDRLRPNADHRLQHGEYTYDHPGLDYDSKRYFFSYEISLNDAVRVDTTAQGIPAFNDARTPADPRDDTGGIIAYSFDLTYPAGVTIACHTAVANFNVFTVFLPSLPPACNRLCS